MKTRLFTNTAAATLFLLSICQYVGAATKKKKAQKNQYLRRRDLSHMTPENEMADYYYQQELRKLKKS